MSADAIIIGGSPFRHTGQPVRAFQAFMDCDLFFSILRISHYVEKPRGPSRRPVLSPTTMGIPRRTYRRTRSFSS